MTPRGLEKVVVTYPYATEGSMRFHHSMMGVFLRDAATKQRIVDGGELIAVSSGANITMARNEAVEKFLSLPGRPDWLRARSPHFYLRDGYRIERIITRTSQECRNWWEKRLHPTHDQRNTR